MDISLQRITAVGAYQTAFYPLIILGLRLFWFNCRWSILPLIFAKHECNTKDLSHLARQLDYISQLTTDIRHVQGLLSFVADVLSRMQVNAVHPSPVSVSELA